MLQVGRVNELTNIELRRPGLHDLVGIRLFLNTSMAGLPMNAFAASLLNGTVARLADVVEICEMGNEKQ